MSADGNCGKYSHTSCTLFLYLNIIIYLNNEETVNFKRSIHSYQDVCVETSFTGVALGQFRSGSVFLICELRLMIITHIVYMYINADVCITIIK